MDTAPAEMNPCLEISVVDVDCFFLPIWLLVDLVWAAFGVKALAPERMLKMMNEECKKFIVGLCGNVLFRFCSGYRYFHLVYVLITSHRSIKKEGVNTFLVSLTNYSGRISKKLQDAGDGGWERNNLHNMTS